VIQGRIYIETNRNSGIQAQEKNSWKKPARAEHAPSPRTPPSTDDLQKSRSTPCEVGKASLTRTHEGRKEDPRRVLITRRTGASYTVPPGDHRDRRGPKTATGRFLSKESQPRLIDLALNNISTGKPPTPVFLHEPETIKPLLAPTKTKQKQKKEKQQPPPVLHWEEETPTALKAWRKQPPLENEPGGTKTLALMAKGNKS
jgi:hypothetical protein